MKELVKNKNLICGKSIKLYQISEAKDRRRLMFMNYDFVQKHGGIDPTEYELVFEGDVGTDIPDRIYTIFNSYRQMPEGYEGRSMSVSDVLVIDNRAYFCDSFGYVELRYDEFPLRRGMSADSKYISYRIYEAPAAPTEKGKYIARTPLLPQALRACEMAKERGKSWFIKGITPDGAEVLLL